MTRTLATIVALALATGCASLPIAGSGGTDLEPLDGTMEAKIIAASIVPEAEKHPRVVNHLALAEALYQERLSALRERRNTVRDRERLLHGSSYLTFAAGAIGVGLIAVSATKEDRASDDGLRHAGYAAIGGFGAGTLLEVLGYMQEDPSSVDGKAHQLQVSHQTMVERLRALGETAAATPGAISPVILEAQMATLIGNFMAEAQQINVDG